MIVEINSVDQTSEIEYGSIQVVQRITSLVDTASFSIKKVANRTLSPAYDDDVAIYDGATKIFSGKIMSVEAEPFSGVDGEYIIVRCVDNTYQMDKILVSTTRTNETILEIITYLAANFAPGFTVNNVVSNFLIEKIVFNQVPMSQCLTRLAELVEYNWYVDEEKDIHFFPKHINTAPFDISDNNGNYVYKSLTRIADGSQVTNRVKVRGGEYDGTTYTDRITVSGNDSKSFKLPYRFANLTVTLDPDGTPAVQDVGIDFIDDFVSDDVLYNFQAQMIRFENPLSDGDIIEFSGNPKIPVFVVAEDPVSVTEYGKVEKLIREDDIESNTVARKRANAELYAYSEPIIDARFYTQTSGLRVGMLINAQSDIRGFDDDLIIKTLTFMPIDGDDFGYKVELISTRRYDFITLLQKMLQPDPQASDESETSEEIFTDTQVINITEEIETVSPVEDVDQEIEIQENYLLDPLGDETNATYVLGPYAPTSQTDTKRPGRLDISLVVT